MSGIRQSVQTVLGHGSAAFTLTVYGHLLDADLDALAVALDAAATGRTWDDDGTELRAIAGPSLPNGA